ncbi:MATE family efflux transporter [Oceanivirga miroungae]|uniref:Multidrug-efflux transporter n=1 Tax=Oceanivirga miroungae TaxID=1130046 RepID=A0A6I8M525_9FUSO|nr:MATE family efflux transporter [Oceanivirga miroungae]VWL85027.1 hypothetical protein OMES3154_00304 [Oceanivirga miroungae]
MSSIYKRILYLAIPITIENLVYNFINFVDIFMVGKPDEILHLGPAAISALGVSNQVFFIFIISLFGLMSGANVLASQYYGAREDSNLRKLVLVFLLTSLVYVLPFFLGSTFFTKRIISFYTNDSLVIKLGIDYLKIVAWTFPLTGIGMVFSILLRSINLPKYTLYASIVGLLVNVSLNTVLIPIYGVKGAAVATIIARLSNLVFLMFILFKKKVKLIPNIGEIKTINISFVKKCYAVSLLTFVHEILWVLAISLKASFYGKLGVNEFSSIQIANNINSLLFTMFVGVTAATSVIVGNEIGNDNKEKVIEYTNKIVRLFIFLIIIIVILLNISAPVVLRFMKVPENIYILTRSIIYSVSFTTIFSSYTMLFLVGIFRAGGDLKFSILIEIIPLWFVAVPITYYFSTVYPLPVYLVYIVSYADEIIKLIPCIIRYRSYKWIRKVI